MSEIDMKQICIPSDSVILKKINDAMKEAAASYSRSAGESDFIKELFDDLAKDTELPKGYLKKISKIYYKNNVDAVAADNENIIEMYEKIFGSGE